MTSATTITRIKTVTYRRLTNSARQNKMSNKEAEIQGTVIISDRMPAKFRKKLKHLCGANKIYPEVLDGINALANSARNPSAIEAMTLMIGSKGIYENGRIMIDAARMAQRLNRQVDLLWSTKRWQDEHDRLSRYLTLKTIMDENKLYSLPNWAKSIQEARWSGYLIRSRKRLAMEGLRQRHCITAWDNRCQQGSNVIAVVLDKKVRWTVDIQEPGVCGAIHGKFNKRPMPELRARIIEMLGIKEMESFYKVGRAEPISSEALVAEFMGDYGNALYARGVKTIEVIFDGCGDSGQATYDGYGGDALVGELDADIVGAAEALCEGLLNSKGIDWYNGGGGQGTMVLHLEDMRCEMEVAINYTDIEEESFIVEVEADELPTNEGVAA